MKDQELILLSPYTYPGLDALTLADEDMACWLNGYTALWHPGLLWQAKEPPRCDPPYDHEEPKAGQVFAVVDSPDLFLPDEWEEEVRKAGALAFRVTTDRETTLANLREALRARAIEDESLTRLVEIAEEQVGPFFGLGMGYLLQETLAEAMEHENLLETEPFWDDVQQAVASLAGFEYTSTQSSETDGDSDAGDEPTYDGEVPDSAGREEQVEENDYDDSTYHETDDYDEPEDEDDYYDDEYTDRAANRPDPLTPDEPWYKDLQRAGEKLLSAREVLYPVTIHLLDLVLIDEQHLERPFPASHDYGIPLNVVASGRLLEKLAEQHPQTLEDLRGKIEQDLMEVCGGCYLEREDALMPFDSQIWNLLRGLEVSKEILRHEIHVYARKRFGFHPHTPLLLSGCGLTRGLLLAFEENSALPPQDACVVSWPSPDGKQVDVLARQPLPINADTFFNLGHHLFKTTREDHTATLSFLHEEKKASPWYHDIIELARLAPVLGHWNTLSAYFDENMAGDYMPEPSPDDFHFDYLQARTEAHLPAAVSGFARHARLRRRIDACWTLAALHRSLAGSNDTLSVSDRIRQVEDRIESFGADIAEAETEEQAAALKDLEGLEQEIASTLAARLQSRADSDLGGYMLLNPCSFTRRVALEFDGASNPLPVADPVKACQVDGDKLRVVVEVPSLGFAWIAKSGPDGTPTPAMRMRLADKNTVRNEFIEAEIDPETGGLKSIRYRKTMANRLGQRLVFNPGSQVRASDLEVTSSGPALGEIVTKGEIFGEQGQHLAKFRQTFRCWLGRPILEMRIELETEQPPAGDPWHAYYGARFAWRDDRSMLLRSSQGSTYLSTHPRPQTPDFLEVRQPGQSTVIFPGGLPFHERHEQRMLDVILLPQGEKTHVFDLAIGLDREHPAQTALGVISPLAVIPTEKGAPHIGAKGWLFHLDMPNLMLTRLHPGGLERPSDESAQEVAFDAVTARLFESDGHSGQAELRCVRDPQRAYVLDAGGNFLVDATPSGDGVLFEVSPSDLVQIQIEFS